MSFAGTKGRAAAIEAVPVPRAQMVKKQDWRYVSGQATLFNYGTHPPDTDVTGLAFSQDNLTLLSRAADDTLKVGFFFLNNVTFHSSQEQGSGLIIIHCPLQVDSKILATTRNTREEKAATKICA